MDPTAALKYWFEAVQDRDIDEAREYSAALRGWLSRGGFEPPWGENGLPTREQFFSWDPSTGKFFT